MCNNRFFFRFLICLLLPLVLFASVLAQKIPLGKAINTDDYIEYAPTVSLDGKVMIYQTNNNTYKTWQLFETILQDNGKWSKPLPLDNINQFGTVPNESNKYQGDYIAFPCLNAGADTLYFSAIFGNGFGGRDIYYAVKQAGAWSKPFNMGEVINSPGHEDAPSISADGQNLYFSKVINSQVPGSPQKIYMARKSRTGKWQTPLSLPETINQGSEKGPRIMPDNVTLIYSSEAGDSKNFNLYFSVLNIKNQWSKPLPIPELNTDQSDMFVSILKDESSLYYCNEEEKNVDIFQYKPVPPYLRFVKSFVVEGTIRDENTKEPIKAQIQFLLEDDPSFKLAELQTTVSSGKFKLKLREDYAYRYVVAAKGYEGLSNTIVLAKAEKDLMVQRLDIVLKPDAQLMASQEERNKDIFSARNEEYDKNNPNKKNRLPDSLLFYDRDLKDNEDDNALATALLDQKKTIVFESIRFATASADLQTPAFPVLDEIFLLLQKYPTIHFQILAHTDDVGKDENNFQLSDRRAASVIQYLTDKGISPLRLEPKGLGETQPIVPNDSDENRAINRRVEFKVIE